MKKIVGIIIIITSWILAGYLGIKCLFIGGIVQIVNSINPIYAMGIAIGILKIIFSSSASIIACLGTIVGMYFMED